MNDNQKLDRAHKAKTLLEGETFSSAWNALRESLISTMENGTDEQTIEAKRQLASMNRLYANLNSYLQDAALIEADQTSRRSRLKL